MTGRFLPCLPASSEVASAAVLKLAGGRMGAGAAPPVMEAVAAASPADGAVAADRSIAHSRTVC